MVDGGDFIKYPIAGMFPTVDRYMINEISWPMDDGEIRNTIFGMHPLKTSRTDGLDALFYQSRWSFMGPSVCNCDLWGPSLINSSQNFRYYALFVDDNTRFSWLYPLKSKTDFLDCFLKFQYRLKIGLTGRLKSSKAMAVENSVQQHLSVALKNTE